MAFKNIYSPTNPDKYKGDYPIIARSSWEFEFMTYLDHHPDVAEWSSEPVKIPYTNPLPTARNPEGNGQSIYIPDFLVTYLDKVGNQRTKLIEIKPLAQAAEDRKRESASASILRMKNEAKWGAAMQWAQRRGVDFLVMTEADLYANHANRVDKFHPIKMTGKAQAKKLQPKTSKKKTTAKPKTAKPLSKPSRKARAKAKASISRVSAIARSRRVSKVKKASRR